MITLNLILINYGNSFITQIINQYGHQKYQIGERVFDFDKSYVMGILNITPDSFSDGGLYFDKTKAVKYGLQMIKEGADILDIGGESTRPNAELISEDEEIRRVIPVIKGILAERNDAIISVDTTKSAVAEEALKAGAKIVNDISGLTFDHQLQDVIKKYDASVVIMHMKGEPKTMQTNPEYDNIIEDIYDFLSNQTLKALNTGIKNIFIDPGIGFGKTVDHNFEIIKRLDEFRKLGFPMVFGASRKSFIEKTLNLDPPSRDIASAIINAAAISNGARIIRTHNVKYGVQTVKLMNKIC
jgi:dihydropteroate synthase